MDTSTGETPSLIVVEPVQLAVVAVEFVAPRAAQIDLRSAPVEAVVAKKEEDVHRGGLVVAARERGKT